MNTMELQTLLSGKDLSSERLISSVRVKAPHRRTRVDVVLGMPKQDCRFHGICRVEASGTISDSGDCSFCGEMVAGWLLRPEPNFCVLLIERRTLAIEREAYHFNRNRIEVAEPLDVTSFYSMGTDKRYLLKNGAYRLRKTRNHYVIHLPLYNELV
ncbi:MAG: hypothetical protein AB8H12_07360 [Lewinella sp.]